MSIQDKLGQFKGLWADPDVYLSLLIVTVSFASFLLGRTSVHSTFPAPAQEAQVVAEIQGTSTKSAPKVSKTVSSTPLVGQGAHTYVASKGGTKYHLPWCGSAKQIKEENKIWFATKEEAEKAGYSPSATCKGI